MKNGQCDQTHEVCPTRTVAERADPSRRCFDGQAAGFDARAGIRENVAQAVGCELTRLAAEAESNLIVDVGAGTGSFGRFIIRSGVRYMGLDRSMAMLRVFACRLVEQPRHRPAALLVVADADEVWPIGSGAVGVLFFSRAIHLLQQVHVTRESARVLNGQRAFLVVGRVRRSSRSVRALLRVKMHALLAGHGINGRNGEEALPDLVSALRARGCPAEEPRQLTAASWAAEEIPQASLDSWRSKEGLAGVAVPEQIKRAVLEDLEAWAKSRFISLSEVSRSVETYELTVIETGTSGKTTTGRESD